VTKVWHKLFYTHLSAFHTDVGAIHFCVNKITRRSKAYFKLPNSDEWKEITISLGKRLMRAETPENARMILFWNGLLDSI